MRPIGHLDDEAHARLCADVLLTAEIESEIELGGDGRWIIWVIRDDAMASAREIFARFASDPRNPGWAKSSVAARSARERAAAEQVARDANIVEPAEQWRKNTRTPLTIALIVASIGVTLACDFGQRSDVFTWLAVNGFDTEQRGDPRAFTDIRQGQVWRLVTPIFVHLNGIHILFNMMWMHTLGKMIEQRQGWTTLAWLMLAFAIGSNCAQYLDNGAHFGGMSGVIYGLFGYVWIRGRLDRALGYELGQANVILMIVWFVLCYQGMAGPIANSAHGAGLVLGMAWGALSSPAIRRKLSGK
ncbi:MAG: rhomboid family intramembrane serine protease [Planctomycetes bacterium]|nr:rhomboid family intramembrane serine protease [Planctomycetota bacterium]